MDDVSVNEGTAANGATALTFTISRDNADASGSVTYSFANVTTDGNDFVGGLPAGGTVNFAAGVFTQTVTVSVSSDFTIEGNETFQINLGTATGGTILDGQGIGTITNDDLAGTLVLTPRAATEGDPGQTASLVYDVTRTGGNGDISFRLATAQFNSGAGYATSGVDYTSTQQNYVFSNGAFTSTGTAAATFTVPIIGDYAIEGSEIVEVGLSNTSTSFFYTLGGGQAARITDNDFVGSFSVADVSVTEGDTGSQTGFFTVTRANGLGPATISFAIQAVGSSAETTATAGVDYSAAASGTLTFAGGQTSIQVPFQVLGDTVAERNEQFRIALSNVTAGGSITRGVGIATLIDNDVTPGSQFGTSGNDTLIANTSGAMLIGFGGDDTYLVNSSTDQVIETNGGGADIVYTTVSYNLGVNEVEALSVANQQTTNSINLIGNYASQTIVGNYGDNVLNGGSGGVDTLIGLFGNDTYAVGDSRTVVVEQAGQGFDTLVTSVSYTLAAGVSIETFTAQDRASTTGLRLVGNEVSQTIAGTAGNDTIMGGGGSDTLLGGAGADTFVIGTVASGNVAVLADFVSGTDRIGLSTTAFAGLGTALDANEFVVGSVAVGTNAQIVYNQATGQLFYDADGTGSGAAVLFAQVVPGTVINTGAFDMIAPAAMTGA